MKKSLKWKKCKEEAWKWEVEAENRTLREDERKGWMEVRKEWVEKDRKISQMLKQRQGRNGFWTVMKTLAIFIIW